MQRSVATAVSTAISLTLPRIGEATLHDGESILVEAVAVVAPEPVPGGGREARQVGWARHRGPTGSTSSPDALPTFRTWGRCAMLAQDGRVVAEGGADQRVDHRRDGAEVGGIGAGDVGGERRLGPPGRRRWPPWPRRPPGRRAGSPRGTRRAGSGTSSGTGTRRPPMRSGSPPPTNHTALTSHSAPWGALGPPMSSESDPMPVGGQ